ncbi:MAG: hypothetical protein IT349_20510 [Candidatus Eisenbacteria bacterium]|nr:hypothetical protein [Candidatus Eisenbacteria bacterium]
MHGFETTLRGTNQTISDLADHLKTRLQPLGTFERYRSIVFVAHSMGGLVVREFLNRYGQQLSLNDKIPMLYLVSVPSSGSIAADAARAISSSHQVLALATLPDNLWLQANQQNWLANPLSKRTRTYCAVETEPTYGIMVVGRGTAIPFCTENLLAVRRNHIDIAKPASSQDDIYVGLLVALQETVLKDKLVALSQETLPALLGQLRSGFPLTSYNVRGAVDLEPVLAGQESWTVGSLVFEPDSKLFLGTKSLTVDVKGVLRPSDAGQEIARSFVSLAPPAKPAKPGAAGAGPSPSGEGAHGREGQRGTDGVVGTDGRPSGNLTLVLRQLPAQRFTVALLGQAGGDGGDGGDGGPGSSGTKGNAGESGVFDCKRGGGKGGNAGPGGPGGTAGLPGAGGNGGTLTVVHPTTLSAEIGTLVAIDTTAANRGQPGVGGGGGSPGGVGEGGNGSGHCRGGPPGDPANPGPNGTVPPDNRPATGSVPRLSFQPLTAPV